jgi:hypothetical protein
MDKSINVKDIQIFLDLQGEPTHKGNIFLSTSHGHYAYVETGVNDLIYNLLKEMSIWGGSTDTHKTRDYRYFSQFELDCADKAFLKSRTFKKICERHNVKFIILDDGDEYNQIMREFWDQMQRR